MTMMRFEAGKNLALGFIINAVLLIFTTTKPTLADEGVHLLSEYSQPITSTTLNWLPISHYHSAKNNIVIGGFEISSRAHHNNSNNNYEGNKSEPLGRALFVCRGLHEGLWISGVQLQGDNKCMLSLHNVIKSYARYELLENVNSAGKIRWTHWDTYTNVPIGAVTSGTSSMYVARFDLRGHEEQQSRSRSHLYTHRIGVLDTLDGMGMIFYARNRNVEEKSTSGEILIEIEPKSYDLKSIELDWSRKKIYREDNITLGETTITNTEIGAGKMAKVIEYSHHYSLYWGFSHGTFRGFNTSMTMFNGTTLKHIVWGIPEEKSMRGVYTVEFHLDPGTGVNVTLEAVYKEIEVPYTGELISCYDDGTTQSQKIKLQRVEKNIFDVKPRFGPIYDLNDFTLVPTTTTTTTTTTTEATTTTTTEATTITDTTTPIKSKNIPNSLETNRISEYDPFISPSNVYDSTTNFQSGNGDPMSLENRDKPSTASFIQPNIFIFLVYFLSNIFPKLTS